MIDTRDRKEYYKQYYIMNRAKKLASRKKYVEENKEKVLECCRKANKANFAKNKEKIYRYRSNRIKLNVNVRIAEILRKRFKDVVIKEYKKSSALELLGCSLDYFKSYIESKFVQGMSWDNYSHKTWHIDHIRPIASFDLKDPEQQKQCFHYTNLQPLWAIDNMKKGSKYEK